MRAGTMRERVTLESQAKSDDEGGGKTGGSWSAVSTDLSNMHARITPVSGAEQVRAGQVQSDVTHEVAIRYVAAAASGVSDYRFKWVSQSNRLLYITSPPVEDERRRELVFQCREDVD